MLLQQMLHVSHVLLLHMLLPYFAGDEAEEGIHPGSQLHNQIAFG